MAKYFLKNKFSGTLNYSNTSKKRTVETRMRFIEGWKSIYNIEAKELKLMYHNDKYFRNYKKINTLKYENDFKILDNELKENLKQKLINSKINYKNLNKIILKIGRGLIQNRNLNIIIDDNEKKYIKILEQFLKYFYNIKNNIGIGYFPNLLYKFLKNHNNKIIINFVHDVTIHYILAF